MSLPLVNTRLIIPHELKRLIDIQTYTASHGSRHEGSNDSYGTLVDFYNGM